ncbi:signal transduction histidine kinase [Streptacidiphilus sp. MAP12-20]|uniref:sensor histidine kinase n=1 Tax=Streptacidiphilus sp. MAP12-20 TaxID=3156299 RepID=UPI00351246AE
MTPSTPAPRSSQGATADPTATSRVEQVMVRAVALFRIGGLAQIAVVLALAGSRYPTIAGTAGLVAALTAESALLILVCARAGALRADWVGLDTGFCAAALVVGAALTAPRDGFTWAHFMYPFTIITSVGTGLTYRRLLTVESMTAALALTYAVSAVTIHHDPLWNTLPNALTYFANTTVAWAVARQFRANGRTADHSRIQAVAHAQRATEQELRARHSRALHDRALQTLETLARGPWITDPQLASHVAAEAAWLRGFVENDGTEDGPTDLLGGLQELVQRKALIGLRVDLAAAALRDATDRAPDPGVVAVLLDAIGEALTNVSKHAGVSHATVRARMHPDTIEISVADHGCGFDPAQATAGLGLRSSITDRLAEIGGTATIESAPGQGTLIRLTTPRF